MYAGGRSPQVKKTTPLEGTFDSLGGSLFGEGASVDPRTRYLIKPKAKGGFFGGSGSAGGAAVTSLSGGASSSTAGAASSADPRLRVFGGSSTAAASTHYGRV